MGASALLHYFLVAGVDEEEIGDLSLDKMPSPLFHRFGLAEDSPVPVFTSETKICCSYSESGEAGSSLEVASSRRHPLIMPTTLTSTVPEEEHSPKVSAKPRRTFSCCARPRRYRVPKAFVIVEDREPSETNAEDLFVGCRINLVGARMCRLAGSTLVGVAHEHLLLTYMIVEINYAVTIPTGSQGNRGDFPDSSMRQRT